jgi:hypothetical protein
VIFKIHLITGKVLESNPIGAYLWEQFVEEAETWEDLVADPDGRLTLYMEDQRFIIPCRNILYFEAVKDEGKF